jgi:RNA polymerase sigma factor (sigma-70 family)
VQSIAVADLVTRARDGDQEAWDSLVERYLGMVHAICRGHRLGVDDAADVNQVVWLRLVEHLSRIRTPAAVGGWIAATARNECRRVLRLSGRVVLTEDVDLDQPEQWDVAVDTGLLVYERDRALLDAFNRLGPRCQELLRLLMTDPAPSYDEVAAALDMPVGSIGPTRGRCLEQLRHLLG